MSLADVLATIIRTEPGPGPRPRDSDLDLFGITHPGKVRKENQDHFLLATVHQQAVVHATSLPQPEKLPVRGERLATILLVADGVGGAKAGREASRLAAEAITRYVTFAMRCFQGPVRTADEDFFDALRTAALEAHRAVLAEGAARAEASGMATTLTLAVAVWPRMYVVQVGDSRCYRYWDGELHQVTRDQTVAQELADQGVLPRENVSTSPLSNVLASAIGGHEAKPETSVLDIPTGCVVLLCSDGLTKHVSDAEIAEHIRAMTSSEQLCRGLVDKALERGGTDNITVIVGRARKPA